MVLLILFAGGAVLAAVVVGSARTSRSMLEVELKGRAEGLAEATAGRIEAVEQGVERSAAGLALTFDHLPASRNQIFRLLADLVQSNPVIYGAAYAVEGAGPSRAGRLAAYAYRGPLGITTRDLVAEGYEFETRDWYAIPRALAAPSWSEPYFDEGGGDIVMATYTVPFGGGKDVRGAVTCDVSLRWLADTMAVLPLGEAGYGFIVSHNGTIVAHPTRKFIMNETIFSIAEARRDAALRGIGQRMVRGETGFVPFSSLTTLQPSYVAFAPIGSTGWAVGVVYRRETLDAKVTRLEVTQLLVGLAGFGGLVVVIVGLAHSITRPLRRLEAATHALAGGNLDAPVPEVRGDDEVAHLAASFGQMQRDLRGHIERLQQTTAAKERIERELQIARTIQLSLVPKTFPPFPQRSDFEIHATLDPAREVGGDFYDFFLIDEQRLCLVIGDVAGKGVPAALYMAVTRTLIKTLFRELPEPAAVLDRLNRELAQGNESAMFVTIFCAVIELAHGTCHYANGGHNLPHVVHPTGEVETVPPVGGCVVGAMEGPSYRAATIPLAPGDTLFLFTDGVVECMDRAGRMFGSARTSDRLAGLRGRPCSEVIAEMRECLRRFAGGAEQSDDITMLAFRLTPPSA